MKISELEGSETLTTKEDLRHLAAKEDLANLRAALFEHLLISERGQRAWIWGLYGLMLVIAGAQWAGINMILHSK